MGVRYDSGMESRRKQELRALVLKRIDPRTNTGIVSGMLLSWGWWVYFMAMVFMPTIFLFLIIPTLVVCLIYIKRRVLIQKRVEQCDHFLCLWCRYPLCDLPDDGVCPECGGGYRKELCRTLYQYAYAGFSPGTKVMQQREKWLWARALRERDRGSR